MLPDSPPPAEEAPAPRAVFRLRTEAPQPSEPPRTDKPRELFFINWKAHHPHGIMGSEEFERAYGDYQLKQGDAKRFYRAREQRAEWREVATKGIVVLIALVALLRAAQWLHGQFGSGEKPAASSPSAPKQPGER